MNTKPTMWVDETEDAIIKLGKLFPRFLNFIADKGLEADEGLSIVQDDGTGAWHIKATVTNHCWDEPDESDYPEHAVLVVWWSPDGWAITTKDGEHVDS